MLRVLRMMAFSKSAIKAQQHGSRRFLNGDWKAVWECPHRRGRGGERKAPSSPPQRRNPCLRERPAMVGKTSRSVAPRGRALVELRESAAGGRVRGRGKLLAGTRRCLHLCLRLPLNWAHTEQLGRCPKPQQGRCPFTLHGALPLDPFFSPRLERACLIVRNCCLCPEYALHMTRCPGRHRAPPSPSNPVSDPHTRGLSPPKSSHFPTISAGMSQF